jgi:hypothetical protein
VSDHILDVAKDELTPKSGIASFQFAMPHVEDAAIVT